MALRRKRRQYPDEGFQMAPMIDMVFLLLVFFMCVSTLVQSERGIELALPESAESEVAKEIAARRIVSIDAQGQVFLAQQQVDLKRLRTELKKLLSHSSEPAVQIRADQQTRYEDVKKILNLCAEVGIYDVVYATFQA